MEQLWQSEVQWLPKLFNRCFEEARNKKQVFPAITLYPPVTPPHFMAPSLSSPVYCCIYPLPMYTEMVHSTKLLNSPLRARTGKPTVLLSLKSWTSWDRQGREERDRVNPMYLCGASQLWLRSLGLTLTNARDPTVDVSILISDSSKCYCTETEYPIYKNNYSLKYRLQLTHEVQLVSGFPHLVPKDRYQFIF